MSKKKGTPSDEAVDAVAAGDGIDLLELKQEEISDLTAESKQKDEEIEALRSQLKDAKNNPVIINKTIEPMEMDQGKMEAREFEDRNPEYGDQGLKVVSEDEVAHPMEVARLQKKHQMLLFMEEPVTVHIHTTNEKNADMVFNIGVNGQYETFERGQTKTVARKFVEGLMRAKPVSYTNDEYYDHKNKTEAVRYVPAAGLRYGFSIVTDENPRGADWYKHTLAQAS